MAVSIQGGMLQMTTASCAAEQPGPSGLSASSHRGTGIGPSDLPRRRLLLAQEAARPDDSSVADSSVADLSVAGLLTDAGFDVVGQATDVAQVVAMSTALRPSATVIHLRSVVQVAAAIRRQHLGPVVMMADGPCAERDDITAAVQAGAMTCVIEPFTVERLVPAIEIAVARYADTTALRGDLADIRDRLDARKTIERAKGILMTQQQMTEPQAFRFLQRTAMDHGTSISRIANRVNDRLHAG
jgi:response regulator NasT